MPTRDIGEILIPIEPVSSRLIRKQFANRQQFLPTFWSAMLPPSSAQMAEMVWTVPLSWVSLNRVAVISSAASAQLIPFRLADVRFGGDLYLSGKTLTDIQGAIQVEHNPANFIRSKSRYLSSYPALAEQLGIINPFRLD